MNRNRTCITGCLLALLLFTLPAQSQYDPAGESAFTPPELDQMLAPIALYPDALLSQILMAATYPLEVVQAARWSRANAGLTGEAAVRAIDDRDWDPSVKSLVAFPRILSMMDERLGWTERLGDAFLVQPMQVMDAVQGLRQRAYMAGNLRSNEHYHVEHHAQAIVIASAYPDVIYVPYYDPFVVYGPWWWPAYRPVYWAPWPGYYTYPGVAFYWSVGIRIGHVFFFGRCDWRQRRIHIVDARPFYYHRAHRSRTRQHVWVHDAAHRRGVPYRHAQVRNRYAHAKTPLRRVGGAAPARPKSRLEPGRIDTRIKTGERFDTKGDRKTPVSSGRAAARPVWKRVHPQKVTEDSPRRVRGPAARPKVGRIEARRGNGRSDQGKRPPAAGPGGDGGRSWRSASGDREIVAEEGSRGRRDTAGRTGGSREAWGVAGGARNSGGWRRQ